MVGHCASSPTSRDDATCSVWPSAPLQYRFSKTKRTNENTSDQPPWRSRNNIEWIKHKQNHQCKKHMDHMKYTHLENKSMRYRTTTTNTHINTYMYRQSCVSQVLHKLSIKMALPGWTCTRTCRRRLTTHKHTTQCGCMLFCQVAS